jgi:hypothetical protein
MTVASGDDREEFRVTKPGGFLGRTKCPAHKLVFCGFAVQPAPRPPLEEETVDGKILDPNWRRDLRRARAAYRIRRREAPLVRKRDALRLELRHW